MRSALSLSLVTLRPVKALKIVFTRVLLSFFSHEIENVSSRKC